jgi:transcription elongation factor Elf1
MTPKCPNHTVPMDKTDQPRMWICPISGARFECDVDIQEGKKKIDKFGKPIHDWQIKALDGAGG